MADAVIQRVLGIGNRQEWETVPAFIPSAEAQVVFAETVHLLAIELTNKSDSAVSVVIKDKQAVPLEIIDTVLDPKTPYPVKFSGRLCSGGLTWQATVAESVVGYVRAYK